MFDSMPLVCVCVKISTTLIKLTMVELPGLVMELCLACGSTVYVCMHACVYAHALKVVGSVSSICCQREEQSTSMNAKQPVSHMPPLCVCSSIREKDESCFPSDCLQLNNNFITKYKESSVEKNLMFQGSICPKQLLNSQHQGVAFSINSHFNSQISKKYNTANRM